ncbi:hypothetical protein AC1031_015717 [Aphanomyces cochlioides]|nr:hypothetical protein AC1031_015717 [Aphanomyces cochlioides]
MRDINVVDSININPQYVRQQRKHVKTRIIATQTAIAHDERFPMADGEAHSNGFEWIILEQVGDSLTLVRRSLLYQTPVDNKGPISLSLLAQRNALPATVNPSV